MIKAPKHRFLLKARDILVRPLRDRSDRIIKVWTDQCEFIFAQRIRRGQQLVAHYRRIWQENDLLLFLLRFRRQLGLHSKGFLLASAPFLFDWDKERISNDVIYEQMKEIDYVHRLEEVTLFCPVCHLRRMIDRRREGISYCNCRQSGGKVELTSMDEWEPYLERDNILIWRQPQGQGQYAYKVYGKYEDVSAEDFFFVQTDLNYIKQWDKTAVTLEVIDTDNDVSSSCNVLYWELLWPKLFSNRDYVFKRRTVVDKKQHLMVIVNQSTDHPNCPILPRNQRVRDYWSYMIIKPKSTFRKPGLEFVVTYFDNPGIVIPPTVKTWVARSHMPDFLNKLHMATIRYAAGKEASLAPDERFNDDVVDVVDGDVDFFWNYCPEPGFEYPPEPQVNFSDNKNGATGGGGDAEFKTPRQGYAENQSESSDQDDEEEEEEQERNVEEKTGGQRRTSWWSYLHPYSYFA